MNRTFTMFSVIISCVFLHNSTKIVVDQRKSKCFTIYLLVFKIQQVTRMYSYTEKVCPNWDLNTGPSVFLFSNPCWNQLFQSRYTLERSFHS